MKTIALSIILAFGLFSCSKTITCIDPPIGLAFISFPLSDIDTLVIKKFSPGTNFQNLLDTINFFSNITGSTVSRDDTTRISLNNHNWEIKPGFDWQIFIPATNRTISISDIIKEKDRTEKSAAIMSTQISCYNNILSIKLDNQNGNFSSNPAYVLFIR